MIDDLVGFAVAAAIDVEAAKAAKKHRWVRIVRAAVALFFLAVITTGIFVTFKYS
jgi:hypothetical protein